TIVPLLMVAMSWIPAPSPARAGQTPDAPEKTGPVKTDVKEEVTVLLAEVQLLVTDRKGNPITDLKPSEIEVRERGKPRRVAYLEPFATKNLIARVLPEATPVESADEQAGPAPEPVEEVAIPAPPPQRWIVLLFDGFNSRIQDRPAWVKAARDWVAQEMRDDDKVSVALLDRDSVRVIVPFTSDRQLLDATLSSASFLTGFPTQDYIEEVKKALNDLETCLNAYDPYTCSSSALQSYIFEWRTRTNRTLASLARFSSALGAIPGRKAIFYMSSGVLVDPGEMAVQTILGRFGTDVIDVRDLRFRLQDRLLPELQEMTRIASGADVSFFTFDTRPAHIADASFDVEQRVQLHERRMADPFTEVFQASRGSLDTVAIQTGGRAFHGTRVAENLRRAITAMDGLYTLGFYRDPTLRGMPKIKVRVARRGVVVTFPDRYDPRRRKPRQLPMQLAVARPRALERKLLLPVVIQVPLTGFRFDRGELLMKDDDPEHATTNVAVYAEAISPAGERVASAFELVELKIRKEELATLGTRRFGHAIGLAVGPGAYRLRARVSDADFRAVADRAIDVTVLPDGSVRPGIQEIGQNQDPEQDRRPGDKAATPAGSP
ncbi:MAG: VWA domain-containing protein, partial [Acidobacteria bacterium]